MIHIEGKISKLLILTGLCLLFGGIFALGGIALAKVIYGVSIQEVTDLMNIDKQAQNIQVLKFLQIFNTLGIFLIPSFLFMFLFIKNPLQEVGLKKSIDFTNIIGIILLFITLIPLINYMVALNGKLQLPESLTSLEVWMRASEEKAAQLTKIFLKMEGWGDLSFNIFLIAILPAISEELLFRGVVQKVINKNLQNKHIGIWISAILFSAVHMQFFGFLPRMVLGAFFGYLLVWTGSLWAPILAHFLNNGMAVLLYYFLGDKTMENEVDQLGASEGTYSYTILALIIFSGLIYFFYQYNKKSQNV